MILDFLHIGWSNFICDRSSRLATKSHAGKSRVGKGISAQAAPGTVRESLPSYGSYYPIMLLFQSSNDKTTMDFGLAPVDTFCTTCPYPVSYMCSSSTYGLVHSNNKIRHVLHLC